MGSSTNSSWRPSNCKSPKSKRSKPCMKNGSKTMSSPMIEAQHLSKSFGSKRVLEDFSFTVDRGDVVGVLGKNGAGKTTLLELVLGFSRPTSGGVRVLGHDSFHLPGSAKTRVGFVPQSDELLEQLTARDQLRVIASFYGRW